MRNEAVAQVKEKTALEAAEMKIKTFMARGYYGDREPARAEIEASTRKLVFAANYAYECGGTQLSSMVLELEGSGPKGSIAALVNTAGFGPEGIHISVEDVKYLGSQNVKFTREDYNEVQKALEVFIREAHIPLRDIRQTTSENAENSISAYTKLRRRDFNALFNEVRF